MNNRSIILVFCVLGSVSCGGSSGGFFEGTPSESDDPQECFGEGGITFHDDEVSMVWDATKFIDSSTVDSVYVVIESNGILYELDYLGDTLGSGQNCHIRVDFSTCILGNNFMASSSLSANSYSYTPTSQGYNVFREESDGLGNIEFVELPILTGMAPQDFAECS